MPRTCFAKASYAMLCYGVPEGDEGVGNTPLERAAYSARSGPERDAERQANSPSLRCSLRSGPLAGQGFQALSKPKALKPFGLQAARLQCLQFPLLAFPHRVRASRGHNSLQAGRAPSVPFGKSENPFGAGIPDRFRASRPVAMSLIRLCAVAGRFPSALSPSGTKPLAR
uniref:Uncharacterized protein n=1 Tax=Caulerpa lentillifera TaxID=148947 RepID=A0A2Z2QKH9_9CHLO|nr:hypothetical protein [Caulerpa lentillifera]AST24242.1 hypothetical protein [Caulerpa lentillifera]